MSDDHQTFHVGDAGSNPAGDASTYTVSTEPLTPISPQPIAMTFEQVQAVMHLFVAQGKTTLRCAGVRRS